MNLKKSPLSIKILCLILSFLIPACLVTNFTLNHFYVQGGHVLDAGWFAYLSANSTHFPPFNPDIIIAKYFFAFHVSLIFNLLSGIYSLFWLMGIRIPYAVFFSITQGVWFGLLSLSCYCLFLPSDKNIKIRHIICAFIFSLIIMCNGISLSIVVFPHIEIAILSLLLCFFALWTRGHIKTSFIPLILGLLVREDVGLHYFGVFILIAGFFYYRHRSSEFLKVATIFLHLGIFCLCYSVIVIVLQKIFLHPDTLSRVYLGKPTFQHITQSFIHDRGIFILKYRAYIYAPIGVLFLLALIRRDLFLVLGGIVTLPWLFFSFFANSYDAGTYTFYYSFPLLMVFLWPVIEYALVETYSFQSKSYWFLWISSILLVSLSFVAFCLLPSHQNRTYQPYPWKNFDLQWMHHWQKNQSSLDAIIKHNAGKKFFVDTAVASIELDKIKVNNVYWKLSKEQIIQNNFALFLPGSFKHEDMEAMMQEAGLSLKCYINDSNYMLATKINDPLHLCKNNN